MNVPVAKQLGKQNAATSNYYFVCASFQYIFQKMLS